MLYGRIGTRQTIMPLKDDIAHLKAEAIKRQMRELKAYVRTNIFIYVCMLLSSAIFFNLAIWVWSWSRLDQKILNCIIVLLHSYWGTKSIGELRYWLGEWKDLRRLETKHKC